MTKSASGNYRVWSEDKEGYLYYDRLPENIKSDHIFKNTFIRENIYEKLEDNQFIYEGDTVNIRDIEERFNCGGDNTMDNTGIVVWRNGTWQLYCTLDSTFSYMHDHHYYVPLEQPGTKRTIV